MRDNIRTQKSIIGKNTNKKSTPHQDRKKQLSLNQANHI